MKKLILLFVLVSIVNSIQAQVSSNCTVPQLLAIEYKRDIRQLATNRLFQLQSPDTALVRIPQEYIDTISEGLAAILNATSIPERDSVFNLYCVHNMNGWPYAYAGFLVQVDTSYSWTQAWQNLNTITGNPFMDTVLTRYNLTITNFYNWQIGNYAELSVDSSWNIFALMDSIEMTAGVIYSEPNGIVGEKGVISYSTIGNTRYYDFTFEWQDCFDGCDAFKTWKFKVNPDCSVEYLGYTYSCFWGPTLSYCDPLTPINCNTFTPNSVVENNTQKDNCFIYPNPFSSQTTLQTDKIFKDVTLTVYNLYGQSVKQMNNLSGQAIIFNRDNLPCGIYFLQLTQNNKIISADKLVITDN